MSFIQDRRCVLALVSLLAALPSTPASATELKLGGYYRTRFTFTDNLFLARDIEADPLEGDPGSDGAGFYFDHRLRLEPEIRVNDYMSAYLQLDVFDNRIWGSDPQQDALSSLYTSSAGVSQTLGLPSEFGMNLAVKRAWAEVYTPFGRFKAGRSGLTSGMGMYFNDGNGWDSDYGDTVDRVQFLTRVGPVYLLAGYDQVYEGNTDRSNDGSASTIGVAYRSEVASGSLMGYFQKDTSYPVVPGSAIPSTEGGEAFFPDANHNDILITNIDAWGKGALGPTQLEAEFIYRRGTGDVVVLPSGASSPDQAVTLTNASISQFGLVSRLTMDKGPVLYGLEYGMASGDDNPDDIRFTTFTFDRDYHTGLILFRQPLPTGGSSHLATGETANGNVPKTGDAVANALYFKPAASFDIRQGITADASLLAAWTFTPNEQNNNQKLYGYEIDLGLTAEFWQNLTLRARGAAFLPGAVFADVDRGVAHNEPAFAAEVQANMRF